MNYRVISYSMYENKQKDEEGFFGILIFEKIFEKNVQYL